WRRRPDAASAMLLGVLVVASFWPALTGMPRFFGQTHGVFLSEQVRRVSQGWGQLRAGGIRPPVPPPYALATQPVQKQLTLPTPRGTVDLYPSALGYVVANGWSYAGRPVFQSYSAYTGALAELNASHLRGADAPDTIFFGVQPIDGRFPSLDDSLSWPELL